MRLVQLRFCALAWQQSQQMRLCAIAQVWAPTQVMQSALTRLLCWAPAALLLLLQLVHWQDRVAQLVWDVHFSAVLAAQG